MFSFKLIGASDWERTQCKNDFCVTLSEHLSAQAGLCVVIPCFFTLPHDFTPQRFIWFKCPGYRSCYESEMIFHSNKNTKKEFLPGFKGRVSFLDSDVTHNNCSIMINDLQESDSESYQFRVNGLYRGYLDRFTFSPRTTLSVKGRASNKTQSPNMLSLELQLRELPYFICFHQVLFRSPR